VSYAFDLDGAERVEGLPAWAGAPYKRMGPGVMHFTLDARMPASTTDAEARLMARRLLRERFQLAWHWTHAKAKVLEMVVAPGGLKVKRPNAATDPEPKRRVYNCPASASGCAVMFPGPRTMGEVADGLSLGGNGYLGRIVLDKTGLTGKFYFPAMIFVAPRDVSAAAPSVPTVLRDVAGLELRPATDMVRVLVIDHVERPAGDAGGSAPATVAERAGGPAPRFEAVSIEPVKPNGRPFMFPTGWSPFLPGGRFSDPHTSLWMLIIAAYDIPHPDFQTASVPAWAKSDLFAVDATPGNELRGLDADDAHRRVLLMLQTMLAERFGLRLHTVERPARILEMRLAGKALKNVTPVSVRGRPKRGLWPGINAAAGDDGGRMIGNGASMKDVASGVATLLGTEVVDKTGLMGFYNFDIHWAAPPGPPGSAPDPYGLGAPGRALLISQMRNQLGLRLVSAKGTLKVWVIDHLDRNPTPN
jgi:uncharacterized protein (TIGR03435 family)